MLRVRLAGEPADERGAQRQAWNPVAKLVQQLLGVLPRWAVHSEKRQVRDVLQRDVDVLGDLRNVRDRVNQLL